VPGAPLCSYVIRRRQPTPRFRALDAERASFSKRAVWPLVVLRWYGADSDVVHDFPKTMAMLRRLPSYSLAYFSVLKPSDRLEPHIGTSSAVLRYLLITHAPEEERESALTVCPRVPPP
jgi:aspartyl/asparaginyl beta-hydroxylase (cupin superfamily)